MSDIQFVISLTPLAGNINTQLGHLFKQDGIIFGFQGNVPGGKYNNHMKIKLEDIYMMRREKATKKSWEIHHFSGKKSPLDAQAEYTESEFAKISEGLVPMQMEDKWFIYMEDGTLWCHRSWTGGCIFEAQFAKAGDKYIIKEAFTAELKDKNDQKVKAYLGKMLLFLIDAILLHKQTTPPQLERNEMNPVESFFDRFHLYGYAGVAQLELDCVAEVMKEIREEKNKME